MMAIYNLFIPFRLVTLLFLLLNCADGHNPSKSLFGKPPSAYNAKPFKSKYSFLSAAININFRKLPSNIKSFIPHSTIGLTVASCLANTLRHNTTNTISEKVNNTNTTKSSYKYQDSITFSKNDYADGVIDITNYKMKVHPDVITNVSMKMKVRMIETELEIGVCNCSYRANNTHEIDIEKGEIVTIIRKPGNIWCNGVNSHGEWGIFPTKNVILINKSNQF